MTKSTFTKIFLLSTAGLLGIAVMISVSTAMAADTSSTERAWHVKRPAVKTVPEPENESGTAETMDSVATEVDAPDAVTESDEPAADPETVEDKDGYIAPDADEERQPQSRHEAETHDASPSYDSGDSGYDGGSGE